jgi:hypothetical protein
MFGFQDNANVFTQNRSQSLEIVIIGPKQNKEFHYFDSK